MRLLPLGLFTAGLTALATLTTLTPTQGATFASDNASNYTSATWTTGSNLGSGFGAWNLFGTGGNYVGGTGLGSNTFGIYAGSSNAGAYFDAQRPFTGALTSGQIFAIDLGHTTIQSGGQVGLNFQSGTGGGATTVFTLFANGAKWLVDDGGAGGSFVVGADSANTAYHFTFTYNGGNNYSFTLTGSGGGTNYTASNTLSNITQIQMFDSRQGSGENFGFNNLSVVPEPSTYLGGAAVLLCGILAFRRAWLTSARCA